jgi:hypothetical protein
LQFDIDFIVALNPTINKEMLRNELLDFYGDIRRLIFGSSINLRIAGYYNNIALVYSNSGANRALEYYEKALLIQQDLGAKESVARS